MPAPILIQAHMHACTHAHTQTHTHTRTHTHTNTHTHSRTHIQGFETRLCASVSEVCVVKVSEGPM